MPRLLGIENIIINKKQLTSKAKITNVILLKFIVEQVSACSSN